MIVTRRAAGLGLAAIAAGFTFTGKARATTVDLGPEQPQRLHTVRNEAAIALIPKNFKFVTPGSLTIGIHPNNPPISTYATDARTIVGFDPDLIILLAESLGLQADLVTTAWADWPLGLVSGRFDGVISNVTVTEQRKEKFDFSTYRRDELGWYVKTDSTITAIKEPKDAAGLRVITDSGTNQEKILLEWNRLNVAAGLKPIEIQYYDDDAATTLTLLAGRADAILSVNASRAYKSALDGKTKLVGTISGGWPVTAEIAVTTRKDSGLAAALTEAVNGLIRNGSYTRLLEHWNLAAEGIEVSHTNPPGLPRS
jgi:polar amino acid transport system substrate-binding protein